MSWTKRQLILSALDAAGVQTVEYDVEPENLELCLRRLDAMMATWNSGGVTLGYPIPSSPEFSSLDQDSNLSPQSIEPVIDNLCGRVAPIFGKQATPDTKRSAKAALKSLKTANSLDRMKNMPTPSWMARGAGKKPWRQGYRSNGFPNPPEDFEKSAGVRLV